MATVEQTIRVVRVDPRDGHVIREYDILPLLRDDCTIRHFLSYLYICDYGNQLLVDDCLNCCGFYINDRFVKGNFDFLLADFLDCHNISYDNVKTVIEINDGGIGAAGYVPPVGRFQINANEGKHLHTPHIHVYRFYKHDVCVRIRLSNLLPMTDADRCLFRKFYNSKERKIILELIKENRKIFEECYRKMVKGEDIKGLFEISYDGKKYEIK